MTMPITIRVNAGVPFPALVAGAGAVVVEKANGIWTIELDYTQLAPLLATADLPASLVAIYDPATKQFNTVTVLQIMTSPSLVTPALGVATATSLAVNGATIGANALAVTGASALGGAATVTASAAASLAVGLNGATNPAFQVDASTASQAAGLKITGAATGSTVAIAAIDSGSNTNLTINAKGTGTIGIGSVSTGAVTITPALTLSAALTYGGVTLSNAVTGTGSMVLSAGPTITGHPTIEGVTSTGAAGTGKFVFDGSPTIATPTFSTSATAPKIIGGSGTTGTQLTLQTTTGNGTTDALAITGGNNGGTTLATLSASGLSLNNFGGTSNVKIDATSNYSYVSLNNNTALNGGIGIFGGASGDSNSLYLAAPLVISAFLSGGAAGFQITNAVFSPLIDNQISSGDASHRYTAVYALNGTIQTSDLRGKIVAGQTPLGPDFIRRLKPIAYRYAGGTDEEAVQRHGFGAQDVIEALGGQPFAGVHVEADGTLGMNYSELLAPLVRAVQELAAKVDANIALH